MLCRLVGGNRSLGGLARICDMSRPTKRLKDAGLVDGRRDGQTIYYSVTGDEIAAVLKTLHRLYCARMAD